MQGEARHCPSHVRLGPVTTCRPRAPLSLPHPLSTRCCGLMEGPVACLLWQYVVFRPDGALMPTEDQSLLEDLVRRGLLATVPSKVRTPPSSSDTSAWFHVSFLLGRVGSGQGLCV